jgi:hypothetical protein
MKLTQAQIEQIQAVCSLVERGFGSQEAVGRKNRGRGKRAR